jgi:uncharacterized protein (UPF0248 family)
MRRKHCEVIVSADNKIRTAGDHQVPKHRVVTIAAGGGQSRSLAG